MRNTYQLPDDDDNENENDGGLTRKGPQPFGHISELGPIQYRERGQLEREFLERMRQQHGGTGTGQTRDDHGWDPNRSEWL